MCVDKATNQAKSYISCQIRGKSCSDGNRGDGLNTVVHLLYHVIAVMQLMLHPELVDQKMWPNRSDTFITFQVSFRCFRNFGMLLPEERYVLILIVKKNRPVAMYLLIALLISYQPPLNCFLLIGYLIIIPWPFNHILRHRNIEYLNIILTLFCLDLYFCSNLIIGEPQQAVIYTGCNSGSSYIITAVTLHTCHLFTGNPLLAPQLR